MAGKFTRILGGLLVSAAVTLVPVRAAPAQVGMGMNMGMSGEMQPITKRGLNGYSKILKLDDSQKEIAQTLLEANQEAVRNLMKEFQGEMTKSQEKMRDGDMQGFQKDIKEASKRMQEKSEGLEKSFFSDLKAILTEEQAGRWDRLERYRRREKDLRFGFMSGSGLDLVAIADQLKIPTEDGATGATLREYENAMDAKLRAFEDEGKKMQESALGDDGSMFDMNKIQEMMKKLGEHGKGIRDLNRQYARLLLGELEEPTRSRFDEAFKRKSFPRVYKQAYVQKLLDAAAGFADLDGAQKDTLGAIRDSYGREAAGLNERWARTIEDQEEKLGGTIMVMMQSQMAMFGQGEKDKEDPVGDARKARRDLDSKTEERLKGMLTEAQRSRLPEKAPDSGNPWADMMGIDEGDSGGE